MAQTVSPQEGRIFIHSLPSMEAVSMLKSRQSAVRPYYPKKQSLDQTIRGNGHSTGTHLDYKRRRFPSNSAFISRGKTQSVQELLDKLQDELMDENANKDDQNRAKNCLLMHDASRKALAVYGKTKSSPLTVWSPNCMEDRFIQMFHEVMHPSYTAAYDVFNVPNIIRDEWPLYMTHETFLWTEAAAIQMLYESLHHPSAPPSQKVLVYKAKAVSVLKKQLMQPNAKIDDYTIMAIMVLSALEIGLGDVAAHDTHKKMLRGVFTSAGGIHSFGPFVRNTTMRFDSFWGPEIDSNTSPIVPRLTPVRAPTFPKHPFTPELCASIAKLPEGFCELGLQRKLPLDVLEVLARIAGSSFPTTENPSGSRYTDFWEACPSLDSYSLNNSEPKLERLVCLALLIYSSNRNSSNPLRMYNCVTFGARCELARDLPRCVKKRAQDEDECIFWVWTMAVDAFRTRFNLLDPDGERLLEQQKKRFPGVIGNKSEAKILQRFTLAGSWLEEEQAEEPFREAECMANVQI